jgi:hypothetical protein
MVVYTHERRGTEPRREEGRKMKTKYHRDNTVTIWSVYQQRWIRTRHVSDAELAAMPPSERLRVCRHVGVAI